jgi:pyruvate kinase
LGASGLVLAAETAIGKFPEEAIKFLKKMIKSYQNEKKYI